MLFSPSGSLLAALPPDAATPPWFAGAV